MIHKDIDYHCTNCGMKVKSLYKKYSETVLKLTQCECCNEVADKYVEYDVVIIIIDLILLKTKAYRHILLNTKFQNFWKLSLLLILLESYCNWSVVTRYCHYNCNKINKTEPSLNDFDMNIEDLRFYIVFLNIAIGYGSSILLTDFLTTIFKMYIANGNITTSFMLILKTITLASNGVFLQLPSVIWDISLYNYHLHFVTLYTCLSQLLAYRAITGSPKSWCLLVIFSSNLLKTSVNTYLNTLFKYYFFL
ncbi:hypothetical protein ABEB36_004344 [Hypothenemus hampei]|uniref:Protein ARV n=1 Tax=Hypothenemus hampei TaxID=57062 RepID=A0ABD1F311_HYPHA